MCERVGGREDDVDRAVEPVSTGARRRPAGAGAALEPAAAAGATTSPAEVPASLPDDAQPQAASSSGSAVSQRRMPEA